MEEDVTRGPYVIRSSNPEAREYWWDNPQGEIHFRNRSQLRIWVQEWLGQISDGVWENSNVDYAHWYSLKPIIDGRLGWKRYDDYVPIGGEWPYEQWQLLEYVGDRMMQYGAEGWKEDGHTDRYTKEQFQKDLDDISKSIKTSIRRIGYVS